MRNVIISVLLMLFGWVGGYALILLPASIVFAHNAKKSHKLYGDFLFEMSILSFTIALVLFIIKMAISA